MASMSQNCFICGKPSVLFYDYFVLESYHDITGTAKITSHEARERVAGIVRISICGDCMTEQAQSYLAVNTKANGSPKLFNKKEVEAIKNALSQMERGTFLPSDKMVQYLFSHIFDPTFYALEMRNLNMNHGVREIRLGVSSEDILNIMNNKDNLTVSEKATPQIIEWNRHHKTAPPIEAYSPRLKRLIKREIEAPYVLWTLEEPNAAPFTHGISVKIDTEKSLSCFVCTPMGRVNNSTAIADELRAQALSIEALYLQRLANV